jgi:hypothetical protein
VEFPGPYCLLRKKMWRRCSVDYLIRWWIIRVVRPSFRTCQEGFEEISESCCLLRKKWMDDYLVRGSIVDFDYTMVIIVNGNRVMKSATDVLLP